MSDKDRHRARKGRGSGSNPAGRFEDLARATEDDGWGSLDEPPAPLATTLSPDATRNIIAYNDSPDVGFDRSINPYRGCEHGCAYCFARPSHAYLGLSPGLDFETRLFYKPEAPALLEKELARPGYRCAPVAVGVNTDAYQPAEKKLRLTRGILEVLEGTGHPFAIITKSARVERDLDLIAAAAARGQASVAISITTLDHALARRMEPRASAPQRRIEAIRRLSAAGVPVTVMVAPLIPVLTDSELEAILSAAREAGARHAGYVILRLPHEVKELFQEWLQTHAPLQAQHVMNRVRDLRGGKAYDARFGTRMRGTGEFAELIAKRFRLASKRLGYTEPAGLDCTGFRPPQPDGQMTLF